MARKRPPSTQQITETIPTLPPPPGFEVDAAPVSTLTADPRTETASASIGILGPYGVFQQYLTTLPIIHEDIEIVLPDGVFDDMAKDSKVSSSLRTITLEAISAPGTVVSAVKEEEEDPANFALAGRIAQVATDSIANLDDGLSSVLFQMSTAALKYGNSIAEIMIDDPEKWGGLWVLSGIHPKPRRACAIVVNRFLQVLGILCLVNSFGSFVGYQQIITDPENTPNLRPQQKFLILRFLTENRDPRGRSWLRAAYLPWWRKLQVIGELLKHCTQLAGGMLRVKMDPSAQSYMDPSTGLDVDPAQAVINQVVSMKNGGVFASVHELDTLCVTGGGATFFQAIDAEDSRISETITGQTLSTQESTYNTHAASQEHANVRQLYVMWIRTCIEGAFNDLFRRLTEWNFGPDMVKFAPTFSLAESPNEDHAALMTAMAGAGWTLEPEQLPEADTRVGFKARSDEAVERRLKANENAAKATEAATQPGQPEEGKPGSGKGADGGKPDES